MAHASRIHRARGIFGLPDIAWTYITHVYAHERLYSTKRLFESSKEERRASLLSSRNHSYEMDLEATDSRRL